MALQPTLKQAYTDSQLLEIQNYIDNRVNGQITIQSVVSATTVTPNSSNYGIVITAQASALTIANPTGVWLEMQPFMIRIKDNGTARAITWGNKFNAVNISLPTSTILGGILYVGGVYNKTADTFDVLGVN